MWQQKKLALTLNPNPNPWLKEICERLKDAKLCQEQLEIQGQSWLKKLEDRAEYLKDEGRAWAEVDASNEG